MNISEDKFANKSADQIVKDVLEQHKQNAKDALAYIQNITTDDGLSLSQETKAQLKKAEDMLVNRVKRESITEGIWPFGKKEEPKKYSATMTCYPPFKKEPTKVMLPPITSLEDPIVDQYLKLLRQRHPHSPIVLDSEAGRKTFYENSIRDYKVRAYDKKGNIKELHAGNLPLAMTLSEKLYESNLYDSIDVLKESNVLSTLIEAGNWQSGKNKKPQKSPDKEDEKYYYYRNKKNPEKFTKKSKNEPLPKDSDNFLTKTGKDLLHNKTVNNLATAGLSALSGISPVFLGGITDIAKDYLSDRLKAHNSYKKGLKNINRKYNVKEDSSIMSDMVGNKDFVNPEKDLADFTESIYYILHDIHPALADKRAPKILLPDEYANKLEFDVQGLLRVLNTHGEYISNKNIFNYENTPTKIHGNKIPVKYIHDYPLSNDNKEENNKQIDIPFNIKGLVLANPDAPKGQDLINELSSIVSEDGINKEALESFKSMYLSDDDRIILSPKFPTKFIGHSTRTGEPQFSYTNGKDEQAVTVKVNTLKNIWDDEINQQTRNRFNKNHSFNETTLLTLYLIASKYLDNQYPQWEKEYWEEFGLDRFDLPTRANIYMDAKERDSSTQSMINTPKPLTREEVDQKYYVPEIIKLARKENKLVGDSISNLMMVFANDKDKKQDFKKHLVDSMNNANTEIDGILDFYDKYCTAYAMDNIVNHLTTNALKQKEQELRNTGNTESYNKFEEEKNKIYQEYLVKQRIGGEQLRVPVNSMTKAKECADKVMALCDKYEGKPIEFKPNISIEDKKDAESKTRAKLALELEDYFLSNNEELGAAANALLKKFDNFSINADNKPRNNRDITAKDAYMQNAIEFIDNLKKEYPDIEKNAEDITKKLKKYKADIDKENKKPSSNFGYAQHYVVKALEDKLKQYANDDTDDEDDTTEEED